MSSPEEGRPSTASRASGVKNLLAMFEKSGPASAPSSPSGSVREQSPARLPAKIRTSFVAVEGKNGVIGLQKAPPMGHLGSPIDLADRAEGVQLPAVAGEKETAKTEEPTTRGRSPPTGGEATTQPDDRPQSPEKVSPIKTAASPEKKEVKKENVPPVENIPPAEQPKPAKSREKEDTKKEVKAKSTTAGATNAEKPKTKELAVGTSSRKKAPSPQRSPKLPPKANGSASSTAKTAPSKQASTSATANTAKPRSAATAHSAKPRPKAETAKPKLAATTKAEPKTQSREMTKVSELRGSAYAPTASYAAKHGPDPLVKPSAQPNSQTAPSTAVKTLRRQNSMTMNNRTKETKNTQRSASRPRPSTSTAHRPAASSVEPTGASANAPAPSSDFLSRMMRPTASSSKKVTAETKKGVEPKKVVEHKKPTVQHPPKRVEPVTRGRKMKESSPPLPADTKTKTAKAATQGSKHEKPRSVSRVKAKPKVETSKETEEAVVQEKPTEPAESSAADRQANISIVVTEGLQDEPVKAERDEPEPSASAVPALESKVEALATAQQAASEDVKREIKDESDDEQEINMADIPEYKGEIPATVNPQSEHGSQNDASGEQSPEVKREELPNTAEIEIGASEQATGESLERPEKQEEASTDPSSSLTHDGDAHSHVQDSTEEAS